MEGFTGIPKLSMRPESFNTGLATFEWSQFASATELGSGSYGLIYTGKFNEQNVVVKSMRIRSRECKRLFIKEAQLLNKLRGHEHIARFVAICNEPLAIMMEHIFFDFKPFGMDKVITSLDELLSFVDEHLDFSALKQFQTKIAQDIASGLSHLHENNIAHRDLKPANVLVSNQYYASEKTDSLRNQMFVDNPIQCKLTDFGESRASFLQTRTLIVSKTNRLDRGTEVFLAPEAQLRLAKNVTIDDLKKSDIWALGMTMYCLLNPDLDNPYENAFVKARLEPSVESLKLLLNQKQLPKLEPNGKYEHLQVGEWWKVVYVFEACSQFDPHKRPEVRDVSAVLSKNYLETYLNFIPLTVSQSTALETSDRQMAESLSILSTPSKFGEELGESYDNDADGTNACAFLCVALCDKFLALPNDEIDWNVLKHMTESVISELPALLNTIRDCEKLYEPITAYSLLRENGIVDACNLSEEFIDSSEVFRVASKTNLVNVLFSRAGESKTVGLYTCEPYTLMVGVNCNALFILDTHPISQALGGNGNGILVFSPDKTLKSCKMIAQWIYERLLHSGIKGKKHHSFAWITRESSEMCNNEEEIQKSIAHEENSTMSKGRDNNVTMYPKEKERKRPADDASSTGAEKSAPKITTISVTESSPNSKDDEERRNSAVANSTKEGSVEITKSGGAEETRDPNESQINDESSSLLSNDLDVPVVITITESSEKHNEEERQNSAVDNITDEAMTKSGGEEATIDQSESQADNEFSSDEKAIERIDASGECYKNDAMTPVFSWSKSAYTSQELVCILINDYPIEETCASQPINVSHNASFLVGTNYLEHPDDIKCDDMGSWKHNGSPKRLFHVKRDPNGVLTEIQRLDVTVPKHAALKDNIYELRRAYYRNCSDKTVRKIVSKLYDNCGAQLPNVLIQYLFDDKEHEIKHVMPHGNSKTKSSYRRVLSSTRKRMKQSILDRGKTAKQTLDEVYCTSGDVIKARSIGQLPRGPSDLYYARHSAKKMPDSSPLLDQSKKSEAKETSQPASIDSMWTLLERAKREEQSKEDVFIRECSIHPNLFVVLANDRQLDEVANFCTHPSEHSVFGIDPTFNIFDRNISLTVTTYRNLKLVNPKTGKQPVFVGPLLMHQKKDWKTFSKFAHSLVTLKPELDAVLACGTDGERALVNGFKRNMRFAVFLRCFLHFKANIERELISRGITGNAKKEFVCEIFGKQEGDIKYFGLVDCESEEEFDEKLQQLQPIWEEREIVTENKERKQTMFEWFKREKAQDIKDSMLRPIRTEAGLGNPPSEYTNNDPEAANFIIKHGLHFNPNKPHEFIENVKEIILTQQRNEDRAVFGKGPYRVREGFTHLSVDDVERSSLSHAQMEKRLADFNKAKMDSRVDVVSPTPQDQEDEPTSRLSVTANESGITTVPQPILEAMFERASNLLAVPGKVIPKPGADDGSFVVAGLSNNIHCVNPGKGGSLSCDRSCINYATKICEHTLAVAQVRGTLSELLTWFKRRKKRPAMMEMVEQSGPKTAGRKPSQRKRTNVKRPTVNEYVDLLRPPTSQMLPDVPSTIQHASIPSTNIYTQPPTFSSVERMTQVMPTAPDTSTFQTDYPSMATGFPIPGSYSIPQQCTNQHLSENFQFSPVSSVTLSDQSHMNAQGSVGLPESYFYLKWVEGTRVSKCYGCDGVIQNPPTHRPDDLIIVCRDMREYRDRLTGQRQKSNTVQNVHFHLYKECVIRRYPNFHVGLLKIDGFQINHLQPEHLQRLATNFGWNLYR